MLTKAAAGYLAVLVLSFILHAAKPVNPVYYSLLPVLMLTFPIIFRHTIRLKFNLKDFFTGLTVSVILLLPYYLLFGGNGREITGYFLIFQLIGAAFPEEFFFRGFLQDSIGRNIKAVIFVSILFSLAHLPKAVFTDEWMSLLSFFPSLAMGWLYMRTGNILPGTVFHFLANLAYQN
jgi:membrane protease YdiL (CAAX protease family)